MATGAPFTGVVSPVHTPGSRRRLSQIANCGPANEYDDCQSQAGRAVRRVRLQYCAGVYDIRSITFIAIARPENEEHDIDVRV